jgi:hypothetical protein
MKEKLFTMDDLRIEIEKLELLHTAQMIQVKELTQLVLEGIKPKALVKDVFSEMISSKTLKRNAIDGALGIGAGLLVKNLIGFKSVGMVRKLTSYAMQFITTKFVSDKAPEMIGKIVNANKD